MNSDLKSKVTLVTGASNGIGAAVVQRLTAEGAIVIATDVEAPDPSRKRDTTGATEYMRLDVRLEDDWQRVVSDVLDRHGRLDVLVNNAAVLHVGDLTETSLETFRSVIEVNLLGCFLGIRSVAPALKVGGGGSIVNLSSTAGIRGVRGVGAYAASKFAITGLTKTAALELAEHSIRVNSVHPGTIDTRMIHSHSRQKHTSGFYDSIPLGRMGRPDEVADLVVFLASDRSAYCTGGEFVIDGGKTAGTPAGVV